MLEDDGGPTSGDAASLALQGKRNGGKDSRVSTAVTDAGDPAERDRREFLDTSEAAALLGLARRTLTRYRGKGVGSAYHRLPGKVVYTRTDLLSWAWARRQTTRESD